MCIYVYIYIYMYIYSNNDNNDNNDNRVSHFRGYQVNPCVDQKSVLKGTRNYTIQLCVLNDSQFPYIVISKLSNYKQVIR